MKSETDLIRGFFHTHSSRRICKLVRYHVTDEQNKSMPAQLSVAPAVPVACVCPVEFIYLYLDARPHSSVPSSLSLGLWLGKGTSGGH